MNEESLQSAKAQLDQEFGISVNRDMEERMNVMCNYSELVEERGIEKGIEKGIAKGIEKGLAEGKILARYEDGMLPGEIARKMGMTVEQVKDVLARNQLPVKAETLPII